MTKSEGFADGRLLVVAFEGWNDAGEAASGAVRLLRDQLDVYPIAEVDPEDYFDYQFTRPTIQVDDDGERRLQWPYVRMYGPAAPSMSNLYLLLGAEPSRGWRTFAAEILDSVLAHEIAGVVLLGAMLADVPHTRPISVFVGSENAELRERLGLERSSYEGPVGIPSVLADAFERAGIPCINVWASVPHYVHNAPSPKATLALVEKLEELLGIDIARGDLVQDAADWESGIDALAREDDDMSAYIEQLEQARDAVDSPEASGEAIAKEFEKYLRRRDGRGDDPWRSREG